LDIEPTIGAAKNILCDGDCGGYPLGIHQERTRLACFFPASSPEGVGGPPPPAAGTVARPTPLPRATAYKAVTKETAWMTTFLLFPCFFDSFL
jgi:hypothetical protein